MSVHSGVAPIGLIAELLAALADVHTPRALIRAIATTLAARIPLTRVELSRPSASAELVAGQWRFDTAATGGRRAIAIADGLAIVPRGPLPELVTDPEVRAALDEVIASAARHLEVVQRLATLSRRAQSENRALRADLGRLDPHDEIVARSPAMRAAMARMALVARHPTTVLLTGESGSGKEVIARELHRRSSRAHRPMLQLNCSALPESLVESELFGHERGAFTGADRAHAGLFERADRGTLFLDEVGELSPAAQAKLLRVLQERQIRRVGGESQIDVDVRLVAATNRPLAAMVSAGTFRQDLLYRLDVFGIHVPPLRERRGDLAPLVAALTAQLSKKLGIAPPPISRGVLARLDAHDWPGNVRELMNVLETALILGNARALELPVELANRRAPGARFDDAARAAIVEALRATSGRIYGVLGAAARLGLKPATLQSKMKKLGIERRTFTRA